MARGAMNFIERHVEKVVLGLGGVILVAMAYLYLVRSSNTIEYQGQSVSASSVDEAIRRDAETLQAAIRDLKASPAEVPKYSAQLEQQQRAGILAAGSAGTLPLAADFGPPVPALAAEEERTPEVTVVTPLSPTPPVVRTGRSEVVRRTIRLASAAEPAAETGERTAPPEELPWVTIAAYFPRKLQQEEMNKAKYATYLSKVYVAGVDVQRQEMLETGAWSDWRDVAGSQAMPQLDIPTPVFKEGTTDLENYADVNAAFTTVKASQSTLMQPEFYTVQAGDFWEIPPLPGHAEEEEEEPRAVAKKTEEKEDKQPKPRPGVPPAPIRSAGTGMSDVMPGTGSSGPRAPGVTRPTPRPSDTKVKQEAQEQARKDLAEAHKALGAKDYAAAELAAKRVAESENARPGDKRSAERLLKRAAKALKQQAGRVVGPPTGSPGSPPTGGPGMVMDFVPSPAVGRPAAGRPGGGTGEDKTPLVTDPKDPEKVAVWFHDDTADAGKTYRYRMRVKLWNRYVGKPAALKNPEQARDTLLLGEWSPPSPAVTVTPRAHFFAAGRLTNKDGARVEVYQWHKGNWLKEGFEVTVGDEIGEPRKTEAGEVDERGRDVKEEVDFSTGTIVLDVRYEAPFMMRTGIGKDGQFNLREDKSLVIVYVDPADGQVKRRIQRLELFDPVYKKLKEEL